MKRYKVKGSQEEEEVDVGISVTREAQEYVRGAGILVT